MRLAVGRPSLRRSRCAFWAAVSLVWLSLHVASIVGFARVLTRHGRTKSMRNKGNSLLRATTSQAGAESVQTKPLNIGDYVVLASDCESYDDALDGPLSPDDVGQIVKYNEDFPKPWTVEFQGRTWCYMLGALVKAPPTQSGGGTERQEAVAKLLQACEVTSRGQSGTEEERRNTLKDIETLENLNPTPRPSENAELLEGTWRLRFASEDVTRSSPFFWGWRKMLAGIPDPSPITRMLFGTEQLSESIFAVTDSLPIKTIGEARQTLSAGVLVNHVELKVAGIGQTLMTTTCQYVQAGRDGDSLALTVQTTQPSESTVPFADALVFPSEFLLGKSAVVTMRVTYLDDQIRIIRNADNQVFVYSRID